MYCEIGFNFHYEKLIVGILHHAVILVLIILSDIRYGKLKIIKYN